METQNINNEGLVRGITYDKEPEKTYLILLDGENVNGDTVIRGETFRDWELVTGRQKAYDYIKNIIESEYAIINVIKSKIIVSSDKVKVTDGITIYEFMKAMKEENKVIDYTSFDISDYYTDPNDMDEYASFIKGEGTE